MVLAQAQPRRLGRLQLFTVRLVAGEGGNERQALEIRGDHIGRQKTRISVSIAAGSGATEPCLTE